MTASNQPSPRQPASDLDAIRALLGLAPDVDVVEAVRELQAFADVVNAGFNSAKIQIETLQRQRTEATDMLDITLDDIGRAVRNEWIAYCIETERTNKPHHLTSWDDLGEWDREADRRIAIAVLEIASASLAREKNFQRTEACEAGARAAIRACVKQMHREIEDYQAEAKFDGNSEENFTVLSWKNAATLMPLVVFADTIARDALAQLDARRDGDEATDE